MQTEIKTIKYGSDKNCPFKGSRCTQEKCALFARTSRKWDDGTRAIVEGCTIPMMWAELANQTQRIAMTQAEMGEVKNATVMQTLAMLKDETGRRELERIVDKKLPIGWRKDHDDEVLTPPKEL
jgi:hypothetical protein